MLFYFEKYAILNDSKRNKEMDDNHRNLLSLKMRGKYVKRKSLIYMIIW